MNIAAALVNAKNNEIQVKKIADSYLPHGSGLDGQIIVESITDKKIVIFCEFHHMNENGFYTKWTDHTVVVTPSFDDIGIRITGKNLNDIKEYLWQVFYDALTADFNPKFI